MRRLALTVFILTAVAGAAGTAPAHAALKPCEHKPGFACGRLVVPLDHTDPAGQKLHLSFAVQSTRAQRDKPVLVALSGGPGQETLTWTTELAHQSLAPALSKYRLVAIDQRGTGRSGALRCPDLQRNGVTPKTVAGCARRLGPRRNFYATRDTVADLEDLRLRLGQDKLAIQGTSYGSFVATQYARIHPSTTRALILDSPPSPTGIDPFWLSSFAAPPLVLREECAKGHCNRVTRDPVGDLNRVGKLIERHQLRARTFDARGRPRVRSFRSQLGLMDVFFAGDFNPYLRSILPGALAAAANGDHAPMLRFQTPDVALSEKPESFSVGLNLTTTCLDMFAPYPRVSSWGERRKATGAALAAIEPSRYSPFTKSAVLNFSNAKACWNWPSNTVEPPSTDPLPDVPALILAGRLDVRTPLSGAAAVASQLPSSRFVPVPGTGHAVIDTDSTGCVQVALSRWIERTRFGEPCRHSSNSLPVAPRPPLSLANVKRAPGVPGRAGRALAAVIETAADGRMIMALKYAQQVPMRGGGLRGGSFKARDLVPFETRGTLIKMSDYEYVPGLEVSGRYTSRKGIFNGFLRIGGKGPKGWVRLEGRAGAVGVLGGRRVEYRPRSGPANRSLGGPAAALPLTAATRDLPDHPDRLTHPTPSAP